MRTQLGMAVGFVLALVPSGTAFVPELADAIIHDAGDVTVYFCTMDTPHSSCPPDVVAVGGTRDVIMTDSQLEVEFVATGTDYQDCDSDGDPLQRHVYTIKVDTQPALTTVKRSDDLVCAAQRIFTFSDSKSITASDNIPFTLIGQRCFGGGTDCGAEVPDDDSLQVNIIN